MLNNEQIKLLEKIKSQFPDIHHQRVMILINFLNDIGFDKASTVMFNASAFLNP